MRKKILIVLLSATFLITCQMKIDDSIQPYQKNEAYWQYQGQPVLLLGASDNDNLFQSENIEQQLDTLAAVGGNVIRNTMSSRDSGDVWPFYKTSDGRYNLDRWNIDYWAKFASMLRLTEERDIIVQIEVWDRFDYSRGPWQDNPFNPKNNVNYDVASSGMALNYPEHPDRDLQPFFHSIKNMSGYRPELEIVKKFQEKLVEKMMFYVLQHEHVLFCMNNETNTPLEWGQYWIDFIQRQAEKEGKKVYTTDMIDGVFRPQSSPELPEMFTEKDKYTFLDMSQLNSHNFNQTHWDTLRWIVNQRDLYPLRPLNNTKIHGGPGNHDKFGSVKDGVEKFCRNIIGGCASARFHRPPSGNGISDVSQNAIKAVRKVESMVKFWDMTPYMDLLNDRASDEAYLSARPGEEYVIYFPDSGKVKLDLREYDRTFQLKWINVNIGEWAGENKLTGGQWTAIETPAADGWFAVIW